MNAKTTIALVVLLAVALGGYLLITRTAPPPGSVTPSADERLIELDAEAVDTVRVERGERRYTLGRTDAGWTQSQPTRFPVQPTRIDDMLAMATGLEIVESFTSGSEDRPTLAELELEPAIATVAFNDTVVKLGRLTIGGRGYAMLEGGATVAVVDDGLHAFVTDTSINDLRRKTLEAPTAGRLERIELAWRPDALAEEEGQTPAEPVELALTKRDGEWYLGEGTDNRADRSAVADFARELGTLRIDGFIEDDADLGKFGLAEPREAYTVIESRRAVSDPATDEIERPRRHTLRLGNTADFAGSLRYATWSVGDEPSTLVFTVRGESASDLRMTGNDFRAPGLFAVEPAAVASVSITGEAAAPVTVLMDGSAFAYAETGEVALPAYGVDSQRAAEWLDTLTGLESDGFAPLPPDADEADATIELTTTGRPDPIVIELYRRPGSVEGDAETVEDVAGEWLAVVDGESVARALSEAKVASVLLEPLALRDRDVLDLRPGDVTELTLTGPGWAPLTVTRGDEGWSADDDVAVDEAAVDRLVGSLATLRVGGWIEPSYAQWRAMTAAAALTYLNEDGTTSLRVLSFDPACGLARLDGDEEVAFAAMELPESVLDRLTSELRRAEVLAFSVDELRQVRLTRSEGSLTVTRPAIGSVTSSGPLAGEFDESARTRLLETLAGLETDRFVPEPDPERLGPAVAEWQIELSDGTTRRLAAYRPDGGTGELVWCTAGPEGTRWFRLAVADANAVGLPIDTSEEAARDVK